MRNSAAVLASASSRSLCHYLGENATHLTGAAADAAGKAIAMT
jgi:hypothetical protein